MWTMYKMKFVDELKANTKCAKSIKCSMCALDLQISECPKTHVNSYRSATRVNDWQNMKTRTTPIKIRVCLEDLSVIKYVT